MSGAHSKLVTLGRISGVFGVQGWIKIHSYTEPRESVVNFEHWLLRQDGEEKPVRVETGRPQGRTVIAKLASIDDREAAQDLVGAEIAVDRNELEPCEPGTYYWADLANLEVVTVSGDMLGRLDYLFETGEHDVMVVAGDKQRLIPFVHEEIVKSVDFDACRIVVDWDPTY